MNEKTKVVTNVRPSIAGRVRNRGQVARHTMANKPAAAATGFSAIDANICSNEKISI